MNWMWDKNMKVIAFAAREDEKIFFEKYSKELNIEVNFHEGSLNPKSVVMAEGYDMVTFLGNCTVNSEVLTALKSFGIKYIASRSTGYNNIDLKKAKELGIKVSNSTYSPYSVAEFTLMTALLLLRKIPETFSNVKEYNFSLKGLIGGEIRNKKVGIIGAGKIGKIVVNAFKSLGAEVLVYDLFQNEENFNYVSLDELLKNSDIISLHTPLTEENRYIIHEATLDKMKEGVIIINTARGELINNGALLKYLKNGKIGAAALDTIEGEVGIFHKDHRDGNFHHETLKELISMKNVMVTSHQAFYTDQAVSDMVQSALNNLYSFYTTGDAENNLITF